MRRVRKAQEPAAFRNWRDQIRPRGFIPPWNDFPNPARGSVRAQLSADQAEICCYCCASIANGNFHIEHFRPRQTFERFTYQWRNLLASCESWQQSSLDGAIVETQLHCGKAKANWFEEGVTVDPQKAGVELLFRFRLDGTIFPSKTLRSRYAKIERTINELRLNAPSLIARRANLLAQAGLDATKMSRNVWIRRYLDQRGDGSVQEFWPALRYNFDLHWCKILS